MAHFTVYETGLVGSLYLTCDDAGLTGCWFENGRYFGRGVEGRVERRDDVPAFDLARQWLDRYFAGSAPDPRELPLVPMGTHFQLRVREAMLDIPYGQTTTYGEIAERVARELGTRPSARAVGGAVGRNPLSVIVPCHRVVGADGSLTGFGGGIDTKVKLLELERAAAAGYARPTRGTALEGVPGAASVWL